VEIFPVISNISSTQATTMMTTTTELLLTNVENKQEFHFETNPSNVQLTTIATEPLTTTNYEEGLIANTSNNELANNNIRHEMSSIPSADNLTQPSSEVEKNNFDLTSTSEEEKDTVVTLTTTTAASSTTASYTTFDTKFEESPEPTNVTINRENDTKNNKVNTSTTSNNQIEVTQHPLPNIFDIFQNELPIDNQHSWSNRTNSNEVPQQLEKSDLSTAKKEMEETISTTISSSSISDSEEDFRIRTESPHPTTTEGVDRSIVSSQNEVLTLGEILTGNFSNKTLSPKSIEGTDPSGLASNQNNSNNDFTTTTSATTTSTTITSTTTTTTTSTTTTSTTTTSTTTTSTTTTSTTTLTTTTLTTTIESMTENPDYYANIELNKTKLEENEVRKIEVLVFRSTTTPPIEATTTTTKSSTTTKATTTTSKTLQSKNGQTNVLNQAGSSSGKLLKSFKNRFH